MVVYYNLTQYSNSEGIIGMIKVTSDLVGGWYGIMFVMLMFIVPAYAMIQRGKDPNEAINYSSLFATLLAIFFYVGGIISPGQSIVIYVPAIIWAVTLANRWMHKEY